MDETPGSSSLVTKQGSSELHVILHPLVLLTISDYITRHTLRQQKGPIVGALLGQQNGREITIEHAFEVHTLDGGDQGWLIDQTHFRTRLEQMTLVHKDRSLDFVAWYTLLPQAGPTEDILSIHNSLSQANESALLLGFHPESTVNRSVGGRLPLTIYESILEVEGSKLEQNSEDKVMEDAGQKHNIKFREIGYSVETDETEMISMNYVAGGGGNATATAPKDEKRSLSVVSDEKGKRRIIESEEEAKEDAVQADDNALNREEEEMIASLTTKANAIKMLHSRIDLLVTYLERLPQSFINGDHSTAEDETMETDSNNTVPSHTVLRQIQGLVNRLDLVVPSDQKAFEKEMLQEANDVGLIGLLNSMLQGTQQAREVNQKHAIVESSNAHNRRHNDGHSLGRGEGMSELL